MSYRITGMGAHPGDSFYDEGRPSWLPYWIDTPQESALKWGFYPGVTGQQLNHPEQVYTAPPSPPPVRGTLPDGSAIPAVPASGDTAAATISAITAQQITDWQIQDQGFFTALNDKVNPAGSFSWWPWALAGGLLIFGVTAAAGGTPRRYGR